MRFNKTYNDNEIHLISTDLDEYFKSKNTPIEMGCYNVQITRNHLTETITSEVVFDLVNNNKIIPIEIDNIDNILSGLNLLSTYFPPDKVIVYKTGKSIVYSVKVDETTAAGITRNDVIKLIGWNWMIDVNDTDRWCCFN